MAAMTAVAREYALDDSEDESEQVKEMMLWIPGNIHQGPKSSDRLQGDTHYRPGDGNGRIDSPGYDHTRDDGGGNFESSAQKVVGDEQFLRLQALKGVLETLKGMDQDALNDEAQGAPAIQQMFELMSALYEDGVTWFKDVNDRWGYDPDVGGPGGKMRLDRGE
jgi:hypothetical protein